MKKSFMAMLLVGGSMSLFAQTTPTGTTPTGTTPTQGTTTNQQTTTGTTQQSTGTTGDPSTQTSGNVSNMSNTATMGTTNNGTMNGTTGANGSWNGVSASTSWNADTPPSWGWNNNGVWSGSANWNANSNNPNNMNNGTTSDMNTSGTMNSTGSYNAYGTPVANLPMNVQMRFGQDFPNTANNQYTWNQYGDWFHTHHLNNGRLWQYFYDQRGAGYALALPVLHTFVPENIVTSALNKYGSSLYSIAMVKTADGKDAYQLGLMQRGQMSMHHLDEAGVTVNNVWRVDSLDSSAVMSSTMSNAAMGDNSSMNQGMNSNNQSSMGTSGSMNNSSTPMNNSNDPGVKDSKIKIEHADGTETKIKTKNGKTKIKQDD